MNITDDKHTVFVRLNVPDNRKLLSESVAPTIEQQTEFFESSNFAAQFLSLHH